MVVDGRLVSFMRTSNQGDVSDDGAPSWNCDVVFVEYF